MDRTPHLAARFSDRHIGLSPQDQQAMLEELGYHTVDALLDDTLPKQIRGDRDLALPPARSEDEVQRALADLANRNQPMTPLIGMGYHDTITPPVIRRNLLENPAWYTAYTPYQPEISQGRLEGLLTFQTMVCDLTGMGLANASLLDEGTAAAEGMTLVHRVQRRTGSRFVVDADTHPQTIDVVTTRAAAQGLEVVVGDPVALLDDDTFGVLLSYPRSCGEIADLGSLVDAAHRAGALAVVAADPLALTVLSSPGAQGADVVVGSTQRFGVPLWFGGPHAGFIATHTTHRRALPGRLVGVSLDHHGQPALRLALQTREQHIRRDRATSNVCTAQSLPAIAAAMYAVYHGPEGLTAIAERVHGHAARLADALEAAGVTVRHAALFDTVTARVPGRAEAVLAAARDRGLNLRRVDDDTVGVTLDETTDDAVIAGVLTAFGAEHGDPGPGRASPRLPEALRRTEGLLTAEVFHAHRSETAMMRELRRLADKDLALDRTMIPLGSCTMKLNAAAEMEPISWSGFAGMHPFAPLEQAQGYRQLIADLQDWLAEITGYDTVSLQPNAGAQGEFAGLLAIRRYHADRGQSERDVCLIPDSAHGTNAASAAMVGYRIVVVGCDDGGNIDLDDVRAKLETHGERLAAVMVTYPSTHGVFEETITDLCELVHAAGGQVYLDGANLNAMVGLAWPGKFGADISHLNLHKTFCIPHGGGGPGVGPVAAREHLAPYLPSSPVVAEAGPRPGVGAISATPWGSAGILPISWAYIALMGGEGLTRASQAAILSANYVTHRLGGAYSILYTGAAGTAAHEAIVDLRPVTDATGVTAEDVAKRLIDHGIHAPTMSFPVAGTLMVEPTESEPKAELDRFCDAMLAIRGEIDQVARGEVALEASPLRRAPHTAEDVLDDDWDRPYGRAEAAHPAGVRQRDAKYWPPVGRIDNAYGDRHLMCSCPDLEALAEG
ncbi:MAG: glycine dehydrogenase (aminomethyl-transferring) [Actinobacteria bacterium QS_8_72_14]|nr:MAG: glycine dehydrogenase (aminomethyl-transferring) [Actinobacteria bacterium QS_8_72_14]